MGKAKTFTISKAQAKTSAAYKNAVLTAVTLAIGSTGVASTIISSIGAYLVSTFYNDPDDAAGTYTIQRRSATKYQRNVLTGHSAIIDKGYQFKITHKIKTVTKTFWY